MEIKTHHARPDAAFVTNSARSSRRILACRADLDRYGQLDWLPRRNPLRIALPGRGQLLHFLAPHIPRSIRRDSLVEIVAKQQGHSRAIGCMPLVTKLSLSQSACPHLSASIKTVAMSPSLPTDPIWSSSRLAHRSLIPHPLSPS